VQGLLEEWKSHRYDSPPPVQYMLNIAARAAHPILVSLLLNSGASINTDATISACISDSTDVLQAFLDAGFDPNLSVGHQGDPLIMCVGANKTPLVKWLLGHGADPNANTVSLTHSALDIAAMHATPEIAGLLLEHGAQLKGSHALKRATYYGRLDMMTYLLAQGADINDIPESEYVADAERQAGMGTALHEAVKNGQADAARLLLEKGANPDLKNSLGRTPLACALEKNNGDLVRLFRAADVSG
jgi:ankyrin repeat protein